MFIDLPVDPYFMLIEVQSKECIKIEKASAPMEQYLLDGQDEQVLDAHAKILLEKMALEGEYGNNKLYDKLCR